MDAFGILPVCLKNLWSGIFIWEAIDKVLCVVTVAVRFHVKVPSSCSGVWFLSEL